MCTKLATPGLNRSSTKYCNIFLGKFASVYKKWRIIDLDGEKYFSSSQAIQFIPHDVFMHLRWYQTND